MTDQIQMLEQQLEGLEAEGKKLRDQEKLFYEVRGLEKQIVATRKEVDESETDLQAHKEDLSEIKAQKNSAITDTLVAMSTKMADILPYGQAAIRITDDAKLLIGWKIKEGAYVAYNGLSGGEKILFEQALIYALLGDAKNKLLVYEAAEVDKERLGNLLKHLAGANSDMQIIVNTCHIPEEIPEGWDCVELGE